MLSKILFDIIKREPKNRSLYSYVVGILPKAQDVEGITDVEMILLPTSVWMNRIEEDENDVLARLKEIEKMVDKHVVETITKRFPEWQGDYHEEVLDTVTCCGRKMTLKYSYEQNTMTVTDEYDNPMARMVPHHQVEGLVFIRYFVESWIFARKRFIKRTIATADKVMIERANEKREQDDKVK